MKKMINCHAHLFTSEHVPEDLLKLYIKFLPNFAISWIANFMNSSVGNMLLGWTNRLGNDPMKRYSNFIKFGYSLSISQQFEILKNAYPEDTRFAILMQDFKFVSDYSASVPFDMYKQEIYQLKRRFPNNIFPFHFMEPRLISYSDHPESLLNMFKSEIENGMCHGLKMYPAEGYFPFDYRLLSIYQFAVANNLPIMTHASIGGSRYVKQTTDQDRNVVNLDRVKQYIDVPKLKWFEVAKDYTGRAKIFSDPNNYIPILKKFPDLKICLAHAGSDDEINIEINNRRKSNNVSNWYKKCLELIDKNSNVYMDISYSLWNPEFLNELILIDFDIRSNEPKIIKRCTRLLFGTDFYLTYVDYSIATKDLSSIERSLWEKTEAIVGSDLFNKMAYENAQAYLTTNFYNA